MEEVRLNENFTIEVSGNVMSLGWKPRHGSEDNLISFVDGQAFYSSTYFKFADLRDKQDRVPHIALKFAKNHAFFKNFSKNFQKFQKFQKF